VNEEALVFNRFGAPKGDSFGGPLGEAVPALIEKHAAKCEVICGEPTRRQID
jgi:hypothetical protein